MIPQNKKVKDLMDFTFPPEQEFPMAPESEIPQMEGLVPQQTTPVEDYDGMLEAEMVDRSIQPSTPTEDPRIAQYQELLKSMSSRIGTPRSSGASTPAAQPDFRDKFADELKQAREENRMDTMEARSADSRTQLGNNLMKSFSQIGEGFANRTGRTDIKMEPLQFAAEQAQAIATNNKEKLAGLMEQYQLMGDKEKAKIDAENRKIAADDKAFDRDYKRQMLDLERAKVGKETKEKANEGQKTLDRAVAKEYQEWTSGGQKTAQSEINKLKSVADKLRNKQITTGGLTGMFPDRVTSNEVLGARADVESTVMNSLRAILGAQFTENEGKRIIQNTWNEGDSTQNNLARLDRLVTDLQNKAQDKSQKAGYFEQSGGTLKGFKAGQDQPAQQSQANEVERKTADGKTAIFDANTKQFLRYK